VHAADHALGHRLFGAVCLYCINKPHHPGRRLVSSYASHMSPRSITPRRRCAAFLTEANVYYLCTESPLHIIAVVSL